MKDVDVGTSLDVPFTTEDVRDARVELQDRKDELPILTIQDYEAGSGRPLFGQELIGMALRGWIGLGKPQAWKHQDFLFADLSAFFSRTERKRALESLSDQVEELSSDAAKETRTVLAGKSEDRILAMGFRPDPESLHEDSLKEMAKDGWVTGTLVYKEPSEKVTRDEALEMSPRQLASEFYRRGGRYVFFDPQGTEAFQTAVGLMLLSDIAFDRNSVYT